VEGTAAKSFITARVREEDRGYETPCWVWQLKLNRGGYALARRRAVHRMSYEEWVGPIPCGLEIDHLCRVPACVNPEHLEAVTSKENLRRQRASMTHCRRGHALIPENMMQNGRAKCCRLCHSARLAAGSVTRPRTHCAKGHALTAENTIFWKNGRRCRECNLAWRAEHDNERARLRGRRRIQRLKEGAAARISSREGRQQTSSGRVAHGTSLTHSGAVDNS
jgi:hypothetical protein